MSKNYSEAIRWYRKAAEKGDSVASFNLGLMHYRGQGISKDLSEALYWFGKAADRGHTPAQLNLGTMYQKGRGVGEDFAEAYKWFCIAVAAGDKTAKLYQDNLISKMSPKQVAEAQRRVNEYLKFNPAAIAR